MEKKNLQNKMLEKIEFVLSPEVTLEHLSVFLNFIKHYTPGDYIYMWPLKRATHFSDEEINNITSILIKNNIVEKYAYIICPDDECCHISLISFAEFEKRSKENDIRCQACDTDISHCIPQVAWKIIKELL